MSSATHHTALLKSAKAVLHRLKVEQHTHLRMKVDQAVHLPVKGPSPKKRRIDPERPQSFLAKRKEKGNGRFEGTSLSVLSQDPADRATQHLECLRTNMQEIDWPYSGRRYLHLSRLLKEVTGRIARARWDDERQGRGKLASWKISVSRVVLRLCVEGFNRRYAPSCRTSGTRLATIALSSLATPLARNDDHKYLYHREWSPSHPQTSTRSLSL